MTFSFHTARGNIPRPQLQFKASTRVKTKKKCNNSIEMVRYSMVDARIYRTAETEQF
jgi:hypothetical protein